MQWRVILPLHIPPVAVIEDTLQLAMIAPFESCLQLSVTSAADK